MRTATPEANPGVPCLVCGASNRTQSLQCMECSAPMALVRDTDDPQVGPQVVSILGDTNVGKTVYLGFLLDMLTQRAGNFEALPVGAYSVDVQQTVISHMAQRSFPPKTPMEADQWYWACYRVCQREPQSRWVNLVMPDIAGESLAAEVAAPNTFKIISGLLNRSGGLMLLVDAALAANGSSQPDFFGLRTLTYLESVIASSRSGYIETPIALVLCKSDYCPECFDDPALFVEANLNRLWNHCRSRCANVEFFACSVVGSLGYGTSPHEDYVVPVPLHTAPRGVLEPFQWVINQL